MPIEVNETEVPQKHDLEYEAYVALGLAKRLSEAYVTVEKLGPRVAAILSILQLNPKFEEKLFRDFEHEDYPLWNSVSIISDIVNSLSLTKGLSGTLARRP